MSANLASLAKIGLLLASSVLFSSPSWAYLGMGGAAEIPKPGTYVVGGELQALTNEGGGVILGSLLEMPHTEDFSTRYNLGVGKIDFQLGAGFKWTPIPDFENQPAMGLRLSGWYARQADMNVWTFQLAPMFSKKFQTDIGLVTPFVAVPVNLVNSKERNYTGTQFTIGSEFQHNELESMFFSAEVAINLKDSYSFIGATINFPFDSEYGFSRGK